MHEYFIPNRSQYEKWDFHSLIYISTIAESDSYVWPTDRSHTDRPAGNKNLGQQVVGVAAHGYWKNQQRLVNNLHVVHVFRMQAAGRCNMHACCAADHILCPAALVKVALTVNNGWPSPRLWLLPRRRVDVDDHACIYRSEWSTAATNLSPRAQAWTCIVRSRARRSTSLLSPSVDSPHMTHPRGQYVH